MDNEYIEGSLLLACVLLITSRVEKVGFISHKQQTSSRNEVLPPFQIIRSFGFSTFIAFAMHLDVMSRYIANAMNLEMPKRLIICDKGSTYDLLRNNK
jgi:hypothetical protein